MTNRAIVPKVSVFPHIACIVMGQITKLPQDPVKLATFAQEVLKVLSSKW